jgi:hypothetical protein
LSMDTRSEVLNTSAILDGHLSKLESVQSRRRVWILERCSEY